MEKTITLNKQKIYKLAEALTYKLAQAAVDPAAIKTKDSLSIDMEEETDSFMVDNLADSRFQTVKRLLAAFIKKIDPEKIDNSGEGSALNYVLTLEYNEKINDFVTDDLQDLCNMINEYIYKGVAVDWYASLGLEYGSYLIPRLSELESKIRSTLREGSAPRPIGPFYRNYKIR